MKNTAIEAAPPKNLPADERRAVTVGAVVALAATQNPSEITTSAIAQHMHLTQGALFRHFPNKDAILQAVMDWVAAQLLARIDRAADGAASPLAALQAMFMAHVAFVAEHPGVPRIIFSELQRAGETLPKQMVQTLITSYGARLHRLIAQGQAQGEVHAGLDVPADLYAALQLIESARAELDALLDLGLAGTRALTAIQAEALAR